MEGIEYVTCPICGKQMSRVTWKHLKYKHQITWDEFNRQYPDAQTICNRSSKDTGKSVSKARKTGIRKRDPEVCVDCGKPSQGERCKKCYETYQHSPEYSKHAKYVRSKRPNKYTPEDYLCPDCGKQKKSPTSPRCKRCAASRRSLKWWKQPEFKKKMSKIHKKIFETDPERVAKIRKGHKEFIDDPQRKEEFYTTRRVVSGEEHHWYRDGSCLNSPYSDEFTEKLKSEIRERDGCCQICGTSEIENGEALSVHHIYGDKANCNPKNLIALCRRCHSKTTCEPDKWDLILSLYMEDKYKQIEGDSKS